MTLIGIQIFLLCCLSALCVFNALLARRIGRMIAEMKRLAAEIKATKEAVEVHAETEQRFVALLMALFNLARSSRR
jgi:hypothetical protein